MVAKLVIFVIICISISPIVYLWVKGIDYMHKNHPNYKGEDLFGESEIDTTKIAGRDSWDDNTHIE
jgi:hypothetical protein